MELARDQGTGGETENLVEPTVRTNFADTALWGASVETNEKGEAELTLDMPENLTTGRSARGRWGKEPRSVRPKPK